MAIELTCEVMGAFPNDVDVQLMAMNVMNNVLDPTANDPRWFKVECDTWSTPNSSYLQAKHGRITISSQNTGSSRRSCIGGISSNLYAHK